MYDLTDKAWSAYLHANMFCSRVRCKGTWNPTARIREGWNIVRPGRARHLVMFSQGTVSGYPTPRDSLGGLPQSTGHYL